MPVSKISFSVPEEIKKAFDETFAGEDRSAIIIRLMKQAIKERRRRRRSAEAVDALLALRCQVPPVSAEEIAAARSAGRP